jgi:hypothetical protein
MVRRSVERCGDCAPGRQCPGHLACATQPDAALAAEIGIGWATFVRGQVDVRRRWPPFTGRAAEIAIRLVGGLAPIDARRGELARICHWRAGLRWESLELPRIRDRPYEQPTGRGVIYPLPGRALRPLSHPPTPGQLAAALLPRRIPRGARGAGAARRRRALTIASAQALRAVELRALAIAVGGGGRVDRAPHTATQPQPGTAAARERCSGAPGSAAQIAAQLGLTPARTTATGRGWSA